MDESNKQPLQDGPGWKSPVKKLWDILMFRVFVLPVFLKVLNLLALVCTVFMTFMLLVVGKLITAIPLVWMYLIALRIVSELVLLAYNALVRFQNQNR